MGGISTGIEHDGQVARITLDAPKANILDGEMMALLAGAFEQMAGHPAVKLLVLEGAGDHFSFGASVEEHQAQFVGKMIPAFGKMTRALFDSRIPSIALVRGQCLGGGMELALICNWVFAAPGARFGQPEIQLGVFPPVASLLLPLLIGQMAADDLCLTGRSIGAEEARGMGLVHTVSENPEEALQEFITAHILPKSAAALRIAHRASRHQLHATFLAGWEEMERLYLTDLMATADANEGIAAFIEKRKPIWQHR